MQQYYSNKVNTILASKLIQLVYTVYRVQNPPLDNKRHLFLLDEEMLEALIALNMLF